MAKGIKDIHQYNRIFLITSIIATAFTGFMLFVKGNVLPYLFYFSASFVGILLFSALNLIKGKSKLGNALTNLAITNTLVIAFLPLYSDYVKYIYPFIVLGFLVVMILSLQHYFEQIGKPFASKLKYFNYALLIGLTPLLLLKVSNPLFWNIASTIAAILLGINAFLALLPTKNHSR